MRYSRHYIQFNDLVFDEYDMISESGYSTSFKEYSQEYSYGHGSYSPFKSSFSYAKSSSVSVTLFLRMKKLPCDKRPFYKQFVMTQLSTRGKLWAVENNTLVWAYAYMANKSEQPTERHDFLEIDVDFVLPEGIWHKADKQRTFLVPFDLCEFMDCYPFKEIQPCFNGECCHCADNSSKYCNCCDCESLTKDMALCYFTGTRNGENRLQDFYNDCGAGLKVVYDCARAEEFFMSSFYGNEHMGEKFCADCGIITGILYSDTEIPTTGVTILIHGKVKDPWVEINGNVNMIKGEYDGVLKINPNGTVENYDECCHEVLPVEAWVIPEGMNYGWTINPGNNQISIETNNCCGTVCAYIQVDALTN